MPKKKKKQPVDFVKWLQGQLKAFRARRFADLDVEALGDEPGLRARQPEPLYAYVNRFPRAQRTLLGRVILDDVLQPQNLLTICSLWATLSA